MVAVTPMANFSGASLVPQFGDIGTQALSAFTDVQDLKLKIRKQELEEEINRGNLDVRERTIKLAELKNLQAREDQKNAMEELGGLPDTLNLDQQITNQIQGGGQIQQPGVQDQGQPQGLDDLVTSQFSQGNLPQQPQLPADVPAQQPQLRQPRGAFVRSEAETKAINKKLGRLQLFDKTGKSFEVGTKMLALDTAQKVAAGKVDMDKIFKETTSILKNRDNPGAMFRDMERIRRERAQDSVASPALDRILNLPQSQWEIALEQRLSNNTDIKDLLKIRAKELEAEKPVALSPGQSLVNPVTGETVASVDVTPPKPEQETTLIRNLRSIGIDPLSDEGKKIVKESITKPGTQININEGLADFKVPKGFMFDKDETGKIIGIKPIPGSKADRLGAGDATKVQMLRTAQKAAKGIRKLIFDKFDKKGIGIELNRGNLFNAAFNVPFSDGRKLRNKMEFGIQGITRGETGAAMPPAEVDNTRIRFTPSIFDTAEIARLKLEMFDDFLSGTLQLIDPSGRFNEDRFGNPVKPTFDKSGNAVELGELNESKFEEELQRRISGTAQGTATETPPTDQPPTQFPVIRFDAQGNRL